MARPARGSPSPRCSRAIGVLMALLAVLLGVLTPTAGAHDGRAAPTTTSGIASAGVGPTAAHPTHAAAQSGNLEKPAGIEVAPRAGTPAGPRVGAPDTEGEKTAPTAVHDVVDDATRDARRGPAPPRVSRDLANERHHAHLDAATFTSHPRVSPPVAGEWRRSSSPDTAGPTSPPPRPPCRAPPSPPGS
jgi:hypothetical protein